jgi:beta-lactamase regulating signal transducer with metallopeptidase domain
MLIAAHWQGMAQIFAERMLNSMAEGVVIAGFGWLLLLTLRRQNSSTRFAVWFFALAAVVGIPIVESLRSNAGAASAVHSAFRLPGFWAIDALVIWAVIASAGLAKIGLGFWQLRKLRQSCTEFDLASLHPILGETLSQFGSSRHVAICTSDKVRVPTAIGFMKPAIVIPAWALDELTPAELNAVVLHELAHLRRWDDWTNLAQKIVRAVLFFHPAVWWIGQGLAREREMACDDFVVATTSDSRAYAQCLVSVAEKSFLRRGMALAQAMVGRIQLTALRVARILAVDRPAATKVWKPALWLVAAFSTVCLISLPHAPKLVAFDAQDRSFSSARSGISPVATDDVNLGAKMIPASFHLSNVNAGRKNVVAPSLETQNVETRKQFKNQFKNNDHAFAVAAVHTKLVQPQLDSPRPIQVKYANSSNDVSATNAVLVVVQTEQVDDSGRIWSVCVWRLTVFNPAGPVVDQEVRKGITPKST